MPDGVPVLLPQISIQELFRLRCKVWTCGQEQGLEGAIFSKYKGDWEHDGGQGFPGILVPYCVHQRGKLHLCHIWLDEVDRYVNDKTHGGEDRHGRIVLGYPD